MLINGASGGVGTYAVQIAKALGAEVHGVCSTRNVDMVRNLGADHVFDYKRENYTESDNEYDLIVDMVGSQSLIANRRVLEPEGRMVIVGGPKGDWLAPLWIPIKAMLISPFIDQEIGIMLARLTGDDLAYLGSLMADGRLRSRIDRRYPLSDTAEALALSRNAARAGQSDRDAAGDRCTRARANGGRLQDGVADVARRHFNERWTLGGSGNLVEVVGV